MEDNYSKIRISYTDDKNSFGIDKTNKKKVLQKMMIPFWLKINMLIRFSIHHLLTLSSVAVIVYSLVFFPPSLTSPKGLLIRWVF